jgi:hypothetical protein
MIRRAGARAFLHVRFWHISDVPLAVSDGRLKIQSGRRQWTTNGVLESTA